ncbi:MAG: G-D-S-L family lipolytic protein [Leeuwenhoekiella sp.]
MNKFYKYIILAAFGFAACEPEFETSVENGDFYTNGEADFSNYVALGNSLTAGFADSALYLTGQQSSYPNIMAQQFELVGGGAFSQPLVNDNLGGLLLNGTQVLDNRLVLTSTSGANPAPAPLAGMPTTDIGNILEGPFNNMGVPGARVYHLPAPGYGNIAGLPNRANPYFVRFASASNASIIEDAAAQAPTFFSLWIGNNDILTYATGGGVGVDQTGNPDPATYGSNDITDPFIFGGIYKQLVDAMMVSATGGVLINIPDVTSIPFFTTVPNNALVLNGQQAAGLTGFFTAVSGIVKQGAIQNGVPEAQAEALANQYKITFQEGANRFLIDVPVTPFNPLGFRQMTEEELLVLTIDQSALREQAYGAVAITPQVLQVIGKLQLGGTPTEAEVATIFGAINGIDDGDVLDNDELAAIKTAQDAYNATIEGLASANNLAFVDAEAILNEVADQGIPFDGGVLTSVYGTGGAFSLDGVHPTPRGYAYIANQIIAEINQQYGSSVPQVNIGNYPTITASNSVE